MTLTASNFAHHHQQKQLHQSPSRGRCRTVSTTASSTNGDDDEEEEEEDTETSPHEEPMVYCANTTSTATTMERKNDEESQSNNHPGTGTTEYVSDAEQQVACTTIENTSSASSSDTASTISNDIRETKTTKRVTISDSVESSYLSSSAIETLGAAAAAATTDDDEIPSSCWNDGRNDGVSDSTLPPNYRCLSLDDECKIVLVPHAGEISTATHPNTENDSGTDHAVKSHRSCADSCSVCLSSFEIDQSIAWSGNAKCPHVFHTQCIQDWFAMAGRKHAKRLRRRVTPASKAATDPIQTMIHTEPVDCPCCRRQFLPAADDSVLDRARFWYEQIMDQNNRNMNKNQNDIGEQGMATNPMGASVAGVVVLARSDDNQDNDSSPV